MTNPAQILPREDGSKARDTSNTSVVPVILLPGVMGSRFAVRAAAAPSWDPDDAAQMAIWAGENERKKQQFLDPVASPSDLTLDLPPSARQQIRDSGLREIAKRENPAVIPVPAKGRNDNAVVADNALMQLYRDRGWNTAVWGFYGDLLVHLEQKLNADGGTLRCPVYASGYDWRDSNLANGGRLASELTRILGRHKLAKQAIFVTHSMGGLVFKSALKSIEAQTKGVVHTVIPASGAVVAYRRFQTGATSPFDAPQSAHPAFAELIAQKFLNRIMGSDPVAYAMVQSGLRGPVELLPSNNYPTVFLHTADGNTNLTAGDVYNVYANQGPPGIVPKDGALSGGGFPWTPVDTANLRARINGARTLHQIIGSQLHPNTFEIFGDGLRTDTDFDWNLGLVNQLGDAADLRLKVTQTAVDNDPDNPNIAVTGDGTVPTMSARLAAVPSDQRFRVVGAEHATCFVKAAVMRHLDESIATLLGS